ncbi:MAG TPA: DUF1456 domain-containing protein [Bacteroidetes bacterium]|jgi:uncharacterized protein YehS (DUF1456 family)|nr:DUF1456 domain-containing protein [Bacteroidota bacterium]
MTTNDILRRTRYAFDFRDTYMMELFASGGVVISKEQLKAWLLKDEYDGFKEATHKELAVFLNGLINEKRGKKEGPQPEPEEVLTNNIVLRKFKIAMNWQDEDILETLMLGDMKFSKHELSALFRKPTHTHYRLCKDQLIRKLLIGMHRRYRPSTATNTTEL